MILRVSSAVRRKHDAPVACLFLALFAGTLTSAHGQNYVGLYSPPGTDNPTNWTTVRGNFANSGNGSTTGQVTLNVGSPASQLAWGTGVLMTSSAGSFDTSSEASDNYVTAYNASGFAHLAVSDDPSGGGSIAPANGYAATALFPFAGGWKSANMNQTSVVSGLTNGVTISSPGTGVIDISGLPADNPGSLMAFSQGTAADASADNTASTHYNGNGSWRVIFYDNNGSSAETPNAWSWVHLPWESQGIYAGSVSQAGALTANNALMQSNGGSASWISAGVLNLSISNINTADYALFITGDSVPDAGTDNIFAYGELNSSTFRITSLDNSGQSGDNVALHFVAVPYSAVYAVPEPASLGLVVSATGLAVTGIFLRRKSRRLRTGTHEAATTAVPRLRPE